MTRAMGALLAVTVVSCCVPAPGLGLPDGRVYEQVSPIYKGGYGVAGLEAIAPGGEKIVFSSSGVLVPELSSQEGFSLYVAHRGPGGWSTASLASPPAFDNAQDLSASLQYALTIGSLEATKTGSQVRTSDYLLHPIDALDTASSWEFAGTTRRVDDGFGQKGTYDGTSADLCHVLITGIGSVLLPEAEGTTSQLYDLSVAPAGECRGEGLLSLRLVAVRNGLGEPEVMNRNCPVDLGLGRSYGSGTVQPIVSGGFNPVSADGNEIFFTSSVEKNCQGVYQLFARLGGERTVEVSRLPVEATACGEEVPCAGAAKRASARFAGANDTGTRVFFTTTAPLSEHDGDQQNDLYMTELTCPESEPECPAAAREVRGPTLISKDEMHESEAADVQGIVRIARDGTHVYLVATGALSGPNTEGAAPEKGAENLYVYDVQAGNLAFIADLCSGPALSGLVQDIRCPRNLNTENEGINDTGLWGKIQQAQSTADGRFLVFSSYARLGEGDTDGARDVYRYDAQSGTLERVSIGEAGYHANGNDSGFDAAITPGGIQLSTEVKRQYEMNTHTISEDGSTILFTTAEPLSPGATNGLTNLYEWHQASGEPGEGHVSLISSGSSIASDGDAVISTTGHDIFFLTTASLVPQDTDEVADIYDARVEGGFVPVPTIRQPCSGDACQGPLTNPAPLLVPGSVSQAPGESVKPPVKTAIKKKVKKASAKGHGKKSTKRHRKAKHVTRGVRRAGREGR